MIKIGLIASTFDLLHAGHVHFIRTASANCDRLICALQTDVLDRPEKKRPVQSVYERYLQLSAVKGVDQIIPYSSEADLLNLLHTTTHHVRFLGSDYYDKTVTGVGLYFSGEYSLVEYLHSDRPDMSIVYIDRKHDYSTTMLRDRIKNAQE